MALHYNLAKVYAMSDNEPEIVSEIISSFVIEIPEFVEQISEGIKKGDHHYTYFYTIKVKPSLDLLGLKTAFEEVLQLEAWTKTERESKYIKETFKSMREQIKAAVKELKKDFNL
jgi:hypothetical protein